MTKIPTCIKPVAFTITPPYMCFSETALKSVAGRADYPSANFAPKVAGPTEDPQSEASEEADRIEESPARVEQPVDPKPRPRTRRRERSPPKWRRDKNGRLKRKFNFAKMSQQEF